MNLAEAAIIFLLFLLVIAGSMWGPVLMGREPDPSSGAAPSSAAVPSAGGAVGTKENYGPPPGMRPAAPAGPILGSGLTRNMPPRFSRDLTSCAAPGPYEGMLVDTDGGAVVAPDALPVHTAITRSVAVGPGRGGSIDVGLDLNADPDESVPLMSAADLWKGQARSASAALYAMERS